MFPSEPLSIGGVVDAGVSLYGRTFKQTLQVSLLASIPYALASLAMSMMVGSMDMVTDPDADPDAVLAAATESLTGMMAFMPLLYLALSFMAAAVAHRLVALARDEPTSNIEDFKVGLKLMLPLTLMMILYFVLMMIGMVLLLVPGIILAVSLSLFWYVPIMEDRSAWSSLWRSHALIWRGNWLRAAGGAHDHYSADYGRYWLCLIVVWRPCSRQNRLGHGRRDYTD